MNISQVYNYLNHDLVPRMCYRSVGAYFPCISVIFDGLFFR